MLVFVGGRAFDVRFERGPVAAPRRNSAGAETMTTLTTCSISLKLDPSAKGKDNYRLMASASVRRNLKDRIENKDLARRKALAKTLCSPVGRTLFNREQRKLFWDVYFATYDSPAVSSDFRQDCAARVLSNMPQHAPGSALAK